MFVAIMCRGGIVGCGAAGRRRRKSSASRVPVWGERDVDEACGCRGYRWRVVRFFHDRWPKVTRCPQRRRCIGAASTMLGMAPSTLATEGLSCQRSAFRYNQS